MSESKSRKKKPPKRVLALPDLEHAKTAVPNTLTSSSGQRTYDHAIREVESPHVRTSPAKTTNAARLTPRKPHAYLYDF